MDLSSFSPYLLSFYLIVGDHVESLKHCLVVFLITKTIIFLFKQRFINSQGIHLFNIDVIMKLSIYCFSNMVSLSQSSRRMETLLPLSHHLQVQINPMSQNLVLQLRKCCCLQCHLGLLQYCHHPEPLFSSIQLQHFETRPVRIMYNLICFINFELIKYFLLHKRSVKC